MAMGRSIIRSPGSGLPLSAGHGLAVTLGVWLLVAGAIALLATVVSAFAATLLVGAALVLSGTAQLLHASRVRREEPVLHHLLLGLLAAAAGVVTVVAPVADADAAAVAVGTFFLAAGAVRIGTALRLRFRGWGLLVVSGLFSLAFGLLVFLRWPVATPLALGFLVALDRVFAGASWIAVGLSGRSSRDAAARA